MFRRLFCWTAFAVLVPTFAAPTIDPISNVSISAGKSLTLPVTANSPNGRPLTLTATSSTNRIIVEVQTNNPFWKMSVVQVAASNAPGAFLTPFRDGLVTVTNIGDMTFMLFRDRAPHTVDVIQGLTASGFYTSNTIFHRVVPGFVIQGGDPLTNGSGGPVFRYNDEFHPRALFSGNGQLALANSGKDTDGSQFFVTLGGQRALDFGYTLFGQLLRGFNVLTNIGTTPTNGAARPLADVIITHASFVPNTTDTVLTLTGTNVAGVAGAITLIADDGAGGRATNTFAATTAVDPTNDPPFQYPATVTNLVGAVNARLTNTVTALDLEGDALNWFIRSLDQNATNSSFNLVNGQLQAIIVPNTNYVGPVGFRFTVSPSPYWNQFPLGTFPYDWQIYSFAFGDTPVFASGTNFISPPLLPLSDQVLATFTNGIPNSPAGNFAAFINWGDNVTNSGVIATNPGGWKEVRGAHTYTNGGDYPVYITIQSSLGASATVVSTAAVPPVLTLAFSGTNSILRWPAWATGYRLQSITNPSNTTWLNVSNPSFLAGYESVVTNSSASNARFYRLKK